MFVVATFAELFALFSSKPALINFEKARDMVQDYWTCDASRAARDFGFEQADTSGGWNTEYRCVVQRQWLVMNKDHTPRERSDMKAIISLVFTMVIASGMLAEAREQKEKKSEPDFPLKEMAVFHHILHPLVHDALPKGDFAAIRARLDTLLAEANAIHKAKLPKKFAGRKQEFDNGSKELVSQLTDMVAMKDIVDEATMEKLFNDMHESFESLAELLR